MGAKTTRLQPVACAGPEADSMSLRVNDDEVLGQVVWTLFPGPGMQRAQPEHFHLDRARSALLGALRRTYGIDCVVQIVGDRVRVKYEDVIFSFDSPLSPVVA